jgi:succinate dehydrogenase/fumarate reductase flavoprotein subunit
VDVRGDFLIVGSGIAGLRAAVEGVRGHQGWRRANIVKTVSNLIARMALRRQESRGAHFRTDFTQHDDRRWNVHVSDVTHR